MAEYQCGTLIPVFTFNNQKLPFEPICLKNSLHATQNLSCTLGDRLVYRVVIASVIHNCYDVTNEKQIHNCDQQMTIPTQ